MSPFSYCPEARTVDNRAAARNVWFFDGATLGAGTAGRWIINLFPLLLRLKSGYLPAIPEATLKALDQVKEKQAHYLSDAEVEALAKRQGQAIVGKRNATVTVYQRSPWVAENAKRRAKGKCELCQEPAPFNRKDGTPYLETHHIEWLANGGADTVDNTVALCPNCHKKMHVIHSELDVAVLASRTNPKIG